MNTTIDTKATKQTITMENGRKATLKIEGSKVIATLHNHWTGSDWTGRQVITEDLGTVEASLFQMGF